jgi:hypothetical protein
MISPYLAQSRSPPQEVVNIHNKRKSCKIDG